MRVDIVEDTGRRLRLTVRTPIALYLFFGVLFVGLGLWCIRLLAVDVRLVVEQQRFTYRQTCLWVFDCGTAYAPVRDVRTVAMVDHEVQVEFVDATAHGLSFPHSDGDEKAAIARDLEAALQRPDASFRHAEGAPLAGFLLGLACMAGGMLILAAIQRVRLTADRDAGTLTLSRRLLLWPVERRDAIALVDIEAVQVVPRTMNTGVHGLTSYTVRLQGRGRRMDDSIPVTFLPVLTESAATGLADRIRAWLSRERSEAGFERCSRDDSR